MPSDDNALKIISDVLEKMIDSQIENTEAMTSVKGELDEVESNTDTILSYFRNGFRSEIKEHISNEINVLKKSQEDIAKEVEKLTRQARSINSFSFWAKMVGSFIGSIAIIAGAIMGIINLIEK